MELTFEEQSRARQIFQRHVDNHITTESELRTALAEIGQFPSDGEIQVCLDTFGHKMNFNHFLLYLAYLKSVFLKPPPRDVDTVRAFVALGGSMDRKGTVNTNRLRSTIRDFDLTIDIDAMLKEVDDDDNGTIDYGEFKSLWEMAAPRLTKGGASGGSFTKQPSLSALGRSQSFRAGPEEVEEVPAFLGGVLDFGSMESDDGRKGGAAQGPKQPSQRRAAGGVGFAGGEEVTPMAEDESEESKIKALKAFLNPRPPPKPQSSASESGQSFSKRRVTKAVAGGSDRKSIARLPLLNLGKMGAIGDGGSSSEANNNGPQPPTGESGAFDDANTGGGGGADNNSSGNGANGDDSNTGGGGGAQAANGAAGETQPTKATSNSKLTSGAATKSSGNTTGDNNGAGTAGQAPQTARPPVDRSALVLPEPYILGSARYRTQLKSRKHQQQTGSFSARGSSPQRTRR